MNSTGSFHLRCPNNTIVITILPLLLGIGYYGKPPYAMRFTSPEAGQPGVR
jgi:hypothetical protein